jgi:hypothetical protein
MKRLLLVAAALIPLLSASCHKSNNLYPVSGKVMFKGEPAVNATVFLRRPQADPANEQLIMGIVREDGSFSVVCESLGAGATPGDYDVLIEWKHDSGRRRTGSNTPAASDRLKGAYADPRNPRFRVTVKAEGNNFGQFDVGE